MPNYRLLLTLATSMVTTTILAQKPVDSVKIWNVQRDIYSRSIDSFRILISTYDEDNQILNHRYRVAANAIDQRATTLLMDRAIMGNLLMGNRHDAKIDSLEEVQIRIGYTTQFLADRYFDRLQQIDSCMTEEAELNRKIDDARKRNRPR